MSNKKLYKNIKYMSLITQLGCSIVLPPIFFVLAANWLKERYGIGDWILIVAIILGFVSGIGSFVNHSKIFLKDIEKENQEYKQEHRE